MSRSKPVFDVTTCSLVDFTSVQDDPLIRQAIGVLEERMFKRGEALTSPTAVRDYLRLKLAGEPMEVFSIVFLDTQHCIIAYEPMFKGTINGAAVYPRAVVKRALEYNSAAVIFAHNHPSGMTDPSPADLAITTRLKSTLELIDVRVLDHFIIGKGVPYSFAEAGLL